MKSKLSLNIIRLRKKKGLSQEKLAELAGINRSTVAYYEKDDTAKSHIENLYSIAKVLGVKIEDLLVDQKPEKEHMTFNMDSRTMEKFKSIMELPRQKRHIIYTIAEALARSEEIDKAKSE